jgi:ribosomal protein L11 methyltransferase
MPAGSDHAMQYHQFLITIPESYKDALADRLFTLGSLGMSEQGGTITVYFPETVDPKGIRRELEHITSLLQSITPPVSMTFRFSSLPDQDWNESWKKSFQPVSVGTRFTILPPWEQQNSERTPLIIDPGMAFGTGHHETTRSCLVLMERYAASVRMESFLDIGTGTGLLAIAASALGFKKVIGVDTDTVAIEAARKNIKLNRSDGIELFEGDLNATEGNYDMIAANLISGTLISLAGQISKRLEPSGVSIMSGILKGQENEVAAAAAKAGLRTVERLRDGKWVTLACRH